MKSYFFKKNLNYFLMYSDALPAYMYVCGASVCLVPLEVRASDPLELKLQKATVECLELNPGPLQEVKWP